jgi:hypothetical protein
MEPNLKRGPKFSRIRRYAKMNLVGPIPENRLRTIQKIEA